MRERNSATLQQVTVLRKRSVTQVVSDLLLKRVRLADEQVRASGEINERIGPRRIARIRNGCPTALQAQPVRRRTTGVDHLESGHRCTAERSALSIAQFAEAAFKTALHARGTGKEHFHAEVHPLSDTPRSSDPERPFAMRELLIEHEKRNPAEMIAMQMGNDDAIDRDWLEAETLERDQRRRPAVQKYMCVRRTHRDARLEASAAAKCITRSNKLHRDPTHPVITLHAVA